MRKTLVILIVLIALVVLIKYFTPYQLFSHKTQNNINSIMGGSLFFTGRDGIASHLFQYDLETRSKKELFSFGNILYVNVFENEIYFVRHEQPYVNYEVCVFDRAQNKVNVILTFNEIKFFGRVNDGFVLVGKDKVGEGIFFLSETKNLKELFRGDIANFSPYNISADGKKIAYLKVADKKCIDANTHTIASTDYSNTMGDAALYKGNLAVFDFRLKTETIIKENVSVIVLGCYKGSSGPNILWSPDGESLAFAMRKEQVAEKDHNLFDKKIVFDVFKAAELGIYVYHLNTSRLEFIMDGDSARWGSKGTMLFVESYNWPGQPKVTRINLLNKEKKEGVLFNDINNDNYGLTGINVLYSGDGKYLAYLGEMKYIFESPLAIIDELMNGRTYYWLTVKDIDSGQESRISSIGLLKFGHLCAWTKE